MKDISFNLKIPKLNFSEKRRFQVRMAFSLAIIAGAFWAKQRFEFTFFGTLILAYLGVSLVWRLSSRIAASFALIFLAACPFFLIVENQDLAEQFAIYAYYFLVIAMVLEIISMVRKSGETG